MWAHSYIDEQDFGAAESLLRTAHRLDPYNFAVTRNLAVALLRRSRADEAEKLLQRVVDAYDSNPHAAYMQQQEFGITVVLTMLARVHAHKGDSAALERVCKRAGCSPASVMAEEEAAVQEDRQRLQQRQAGGSEAGSAVDPPMPASAAVDEVGNTAPLHAAAGGSSVQDTQQRMLQEQLLQRRRRQQQQQQQQGQ